MYNLYLLADGVEQLQTCQPVKDKNRTVAGNGECRNASWVQGMLLPENFENPPFSWHLVQFQARNVEKS